MVKNYPTMPNEIGIGNVLSRVLIPRGYQFQYFQYTNFGGMSSTYGNCFASSILHMGIFSAAVNSFKIKILDCI
eukprot:4472605-Ditylum_brightwellii.AAC.1